MNYPATIHWNVATQRLFQPIRQNNNKLSMSAGPTRRPSTKLSTIRNPIPIDIWRLMGLFQSIAEATHDNIHVRGASLQTTH